MRSAAPTLVLALVFAAAAALAAADQPAAPTTPAPAIPAPSVPAPSAPREFVCVFLHGYAFAGPGTKSVNRVTDPKYALSKLPWYWGSIHKRIAPVCTRVITYYTETQVRGWQTPSLMREYCDVLAHYKADVVFTHSMGNQVIAAGIDAKLNGCHNIGRGVDQVHWYMSQAPMRGSPMAAVSAKMCDNRLVAPVVKLFVKACDGTLKTGYKAGEGLASLLPQNCPAKWTDVASAHSAGSMCGVVTANTKVQSDKPLTGAMKLRDQIGLTLGAKITAHEYPLDRDWTTDTAADPNSHPTYGTDGMVGFASCRVAPAAEYRKDPTAAHYMLDGNHADGTCRYGESRNGKRKNFMPCSWMVNMARRSRQTKQPDFVMPSDAVFAAARFAAETEAAEADADADADVEADADAEAEAEVAAELEVTFSRADIADAFDALAEADTAVSADVADALAQALGQSEADTDDVDADADADADADVEADADADADADVEEAYAAIDAAL